MYAVYYKNKQGVWQTDSEEFHSQREGKKRLSYIKRKVALKGQATLKPI